MTAVGLAFFGAIDSTTPMPGLLSACRMSDPEPVAPATRPPFGSGPALNGFRQGVQLPARTVRSRSRSRYLEESQGAVGLRPPHTAPGNDPRRSACRSVQDLAQEQLRALVLRVAEELVGRVH